MHDLIFLALILLYGPELSTKQKVATTLSTETLSSVYSKVKSNLTYTAYLRDASSSASIKAVQNEKLALSLTHASKFKISHCVLAVCLPIYIFPRYSQTKLKHVVFSSAPTMPVAICFLIIKA